MKREAPGATPALVLGILSIVLCGLLGIWGIIESNKALNACDEDPELTGHSMATAGKVTSIVGLVLLGVYITMWAALGATVFGFAQAQ